MAKRVSLTLSLPKSLRERLEEAAKEERRSLNNLAQIALDDWLAQRELLHPQFVADIREALAGTQAGQVEPVWKE
ncbi:MAG TPA: hypothetical protein ENI60_08830 [Candidatus Fraserbacteria bacterium]|nr:hypothetical protein [Candidatus Fraserbacteria bacterium]